MSYNPLPVIVSFVLVTFVNSLMQAASFNCHTSPLPLCNHRMIFMFLYSRILYVQRTNEAHVSALCFPKLLIAAMSCISSRQHTIDDATDISPDSKDHGTNMGPTWVLSAPDRPHVGPLNLAIRVTEELVFDICFVYPVPNTLDEWILGRGQWFIFKQG